MPISELKSTDTETYNKWWKDCETNGYPFVVVHHRKKYSSIEWDYLTIPKEKDGLLKSEALTLELKDVIDSIDKELLCYGQRKKCVVHGRTGVGSIENLPPKLAVIVAERIFNILYKTIN